MAGNFTPIRAFNYVAGALIVALQNNTNENELYNKLGGSMNAATGHQHTGAVGDAPPIPASGLSLFPPLYIDQINNRIGINTNTPLVDLDIRRAAIGSDVAQSIVNSDNTNVLSRAVMNVTTGGAAGGDPLYYLSTNVNDLYIGLDNSDGDKFKIGTGAVVGTNTKLTYDPALNYWGFFTDSPGVDFSVGKSVVGGYFNVVFANSDNTNAASHSRVNISVGGAGGGNPSLQWSVPGVADYSMGIVNTAGDRFTFSESSVLDTNNRMVFDRANQRWGFFTDAPTVDFHISKATVGGAVTSAVQNSDNTNVASHAYFAVDTGGAGSGDPMFLLAIDGVTTYYMGIDNSDSDYFKIGTGAVVGTNTAIQVQSSSSVGVNPSQASAASPTFWFNTTNFGLSSTAGNNFNLYNLAGGNWTFYNGGGTPDRAWVDNDGGFNTRSTSTDLPGANIAGHSIKNAIGARVLVTVAGGTVIDEEYNVDSVTNAVAGIYVTNFTTAIANYTVHMSHSADNNVAPNFGVSVYGVYQMALTFTTICEQSIDIVGVVATARFWGVSCVGVS